MDTLHPAVAIIERDSATRELYRRELSQEYEVFSCASLDEARQVLAQQPIRLVVLEPVGCGWDVLAELKSGVLLLVCTTNDTIDAAIRTQLAAYLIKPVLPSVLLGAARQALGADQR